MFLLKCYHSLNFAVRAIKEKAFIIYPLVPSQGGTAAQKKTKNKTKTKTKKKMSVPSTISK